MPRRKGEREDGLFQAVLELESDGTGKRNRKVFYGHSRKEAELKRAEYKDMLRRSATHIDPNIKLGEWVREYLETYRTNVNPAYLKSDNVPYNKLCAALGTKPVQKVTELDLQRLLNAEAGKSFSSVEKLRQAIKRVFLKARRNGIIVVDPAEDLQLPKYSKGTHRALESWEVDCIRSNYSTHRAGLWVMIMLYAGLRRGEMIALEWGSVDLINRTLTVCQTAVVKVNQTSIEPRAKTEAGIRVIPICEALYQALSTVPEDKRSGLVCLSAKGTQLSESAVSRGLEAFNHAMERASGKPFCVRYHDLRHTFCTMLYSAGVDVKSAAYLMGHADFRVTLGIYTHLTAEKRKSASAQFINALDAQFPAYGSNDGSNQAISEDFWENYENDF